MSLDESRIKDEITKRWDYSSQRYDSYPGHGIKHEEEAEAWKALFGKAIPGKGLSILDVGCGTGEMSRMLAEMGHKVTGIDLSEKMLAVAKAKALPGAEFRLGDAEKPPFDEGTFDAVVTRHVLWTLPHPEKALEGWRKVLKPGGVCVVIDALWNDSSPGSRLRRKIGDVLILIVEKNDISRDSYTAEMNAELPNSKGVPAEKARDYMEKAGLGSIKVTMLDGLMAIQKKHMPLRYGISYNYDYYAITGKKL